MDFWRRSWEVEVELQSSSQVLVSLPGVRDIVDRFEVLRHTTGRFQAGKRRKGMWMSLGDTEHTSIEVWMRSVEPKYTATQISGGIRENTVLQ